MSQSKEVRSRDTRDRDLRRNHDKSRSNSRNPNKRSDTFSKVISVSCEVMSCQRWYIDVDKVPKDYRMRVTDMTRHVRDVYFDSNRGPAGRVHFGVSMYHDMALRLNRLDPPINLEVPRVNGLPLPPKVTIDEPRRDRRYDSKRCGTGVLAEQGTKRKTIQIVDLTISTGPDQHERTRTRPISRSSERPTSSQMTSSKDDRLKLEKESSMLSLAGRLKVSDIPGFEIVQHLIEPYCMKKPSTWRMGCYKKFDVLLSSSRVQQLNAKENKQIVLLRLVLLKSKSGRVADLRDEGSDVMTLDDVEVNRRRVRIPKGQAGRLNLDITRYINGGTNSVSVNARISQRRDKSLDILCSITIVRRLDARENLKSIKARRHISLKWTKKLFTRKLKEAHENGLLVKDSKLPLSLKCPIGKGLIKVPCRGVFCDHLSCFDGFNFLQTFEKAKRWVCPLCDCHIDREDLQIDSFVEMILTSAEPGDLVNDFMIDVDVEGRISKSVPVKKFREEASCSQIMVDLASDSEDEYEETLSQCGLEIPNRCASTSTSTPLWTLKEGFQNVEVASNFSQILSAEALPETSAKMSPARTSLTDVAVSKSVMQHGLTQPTEEVSKTNCILPDKIRSEGGRGTMKDDFPESGALHAEIAALPEVALGWGASISQIVLPEVMENVRLPEVIELESSNARRHDWKYKCTMSVIPLPDPTCNEIAGIWAAKAIHKTHANTSPTTIYACPQKRNGHDHSYANMGGKKNSGERNCASQTGCTELKVPVHVHRIIETDLKAPDLNLPETMASLSETLISDFSLDCFPLEDGTVLSKSELTTPNKRVYEAFTPGDSERTRTFSKKPRTEQEIVVWDTTTSELDCTEDNHSIPVSSSAATTSNVNGEESNEWKNSSSVGDKLRGNSFRSVYF